MYWWWRWWQISAMYIYCLAHVLLAYYPPAPPGLPPLCPCNAWTLSSRQRQIQTQCKKANTNWPTAPLALPPIYLVLQRSLEANQDRRSISHNARSSVSISVGFETTTMANNVSQRTKGCNCRGEITFVLRRQSLKDGWWTDTHLYRQDYGGKSFLLGLSVCLCSFEILLCAWFPSFSIHTNV